MSSTHASNGLADRTFDVVTIAFGIRNVTRIDQALGMPTGKAPRRSVLAA